MSDKHITAIREWHCNWITVQSSDHCFTLNSLYPLSSPGPVWLCSGHFAPSSQLVRFRECIDKPQSGNRSKDPVVTRYQLDPSHLRLRDSGFGLSFQQLTAAPVSQRIPRVSTSRGQSFLEPVSTCISDGLIADTRLRSYAPSGWWQSVKSAVTTSP